MAKQIYERQKTIKLVGVLEKDDSDNYVVTVEGKDSFEEIPLNDVLSDMLGTEISLISTEAL